MKKMAAHLLKHTRHAWGLLLLTAALAGRAATLTWSPDFDGTDGAGTWDTVTTNWFDGAGHVAWNNGTPDDALIGVTNGAAGTITLGESMTAGSIAFNAAGTNSYMLAGQTLTMAGPTLRANAAAAINCEIDGGSIAKLGGATLTLGGTNTYTGATTINGGTLRLGADHVLPDTTDITVLSGALAMNSHTDAVNSLTAYVAVNTGTGLLTLLSEGEALVYKTNLSVTAGLKLGGVTGGTVVVDYAQSASANLQGSLDLGGVPRVFRVENVNASGSDLFDASAKANGGVIKTGGGTLKYEGLNTYTGLTDIQAGELYVQFAGNHIADTAPVQISGGIFRVDNSETVGAVTLAGGAISGNAELIGSSFDLRSGTINGKLGGGATATKTTGGTVTFTAASPLTGLVDIVAGTLALSGGGSLANVPVIAIAAGATLDVSGVANFNLPAGRRLAGDGLVSGKVNAVSGSVITPGTDGTAGLLTFASNLTLNAGAYVYVDAGTNTDRLRIDRELSPNGGAIAVRSDGSLTNGSTFTAGSFASKNASDFRTMAGNLAPEVTGPVNFYVATAGTNIVVTMLDRFTDGSPLRWNSPASGAWDVALADNWLNSVSGTNDLFYNGDPVLFDDTPGVQQTVTVAAGGVLPADVAISTWSNGFTIGGGSIGGTASVTKALRGTARLNNANTYAGLTVISGGTLRVGHALALGGTAQGTLVLGGTGAVSFVGSQLELMNGVTVSGEPLYMRSTSDGVYPDVYRATLIVNSGNTATWDGPVTIAGDVNIVQFSANGNLTVSGPVQGALTNVEFWIRGGGNGIIAPGCVFDIGNTAVAKVDAGKWTVQSTGNIWRATTINTGTLIVDGTILPPAFCKVASTSSTLSGRGYVGGPVTNIGFVAPGNPLGVLTLGTNYVQNSAGVLVIELGGTNHGVDYDALAAGGNASLNGRLDVVVTNAFVPTAGNTFTVLTALAVSGRFSATNLPAIATNLAWTVAYEPAAVVLSIESLDPPPPYDAWSNLFALAQGPEGDDDADGFANLLEYVTGGNPTNTDDVARMSGGRTGGVFALVFTRDTNAVDATLVVEGGDAAADDAVWTGIATNSAGSWGAAPNVVEAGAANPVTVTVLDTAPPAANRFLRLRVTRP